MRDRPLEGLSEAEEKEREEKLEELRPKEYLEHQLGYTITLLDPYEAGIELLRHRLANVRLGAALAFGNIKDVKLLEKVYRLHQDGGTPWFVHAAYRALDHMLIRFEYSGEKEAIGELKTLREKLEGDDMHPGFEGRLDWTIQSMEEYMEEQEIVIENALRKLEVENKRKERLAQR